MSTIDRHLEPGETPVPLDDVQPGDWVWTRVCGYAGWVRVERVTPPGRGRRWVNGGHAFDHCWREARRPGGAGT